MMYLGNNPVGLEHTNFSHTLIPKGNIESIISHGTEYIITDIYPKKGDFIIVDFMIDAWSRYGHYIGASYSNGSRIVFQAGPGASSAVTFSSSGSSATIPLPDIINQKLHVIFCTDLVSINNVSSIDTSTINPLTIYAGYYSNNLESLYGIGKFYGLKILDISTLTNKNILVPWLDENDIPCIKDLVTEQLYYNVGTGAFGYVDLNGTVHNS